MSHFLFPLRPLLKTVFNRSSVSCPIHLQRLSKYSTVSFPNTARPEVDADRFGEVTIWPSIYSLLPKVTAEIWKHGSNKVWWGRNVSCQTRCAVQTYLKSKMAQPNKVLKTQSKGQVRGWRGDNCPNDDYDEHFQTLSPWRHYILLHKKLEKEPDQSLCDIGIPVGLLALESYKNAWIFSSPNNIIEKFDLMMAIDHQNNFLILKVEPVGTTLFIH